MSDADFDQIRKLQQERNAAAAAKKGSRSDSQRADTGSKAKMNDVFDTDLYEREGGDKFAGYHTSLPSGPGDEDEEMADEDADDEEELDESVVLIIYRIR